MGPACADGVATWYRRAQGVIIRRTPSSLRGRVAQFIKTAQVSCIQALQLLCVLLCCWLGCSGAASALAPERSMRQLYHTAWANKDGAPGEIFTMAQTADGYLWLGTPTGLIRFDGLNFEPLAALVSSPLPSNDIYSLLATPEGALWIGLGAHGIAGLQAGRLSLFGAREGVPAGPVYALARDAQGGVWAASRTALLRFDGTRWASVPDLPDGGTQTVFVDSAGRIWLATRDSVLMAARPGMAFQPMGVKIGTVAQFAEAGDGSIWLAETTRSVRRIWQAMAPTTEAGAELQVGSNTLLFDRDGALWVGTLGDGLRRSGHPLQLQGKIARFAADVDQYGEPQGLSSDFTYTLLEDRDGDIWVGSSRGLDRFRQGAVVPVPLPSSYHALALQAAADGRMWVGSAGRPLVSVGPNGDLQDSGLNIGLSSGYRDAWGDYWWSKEPYLVHRSAGQPAGQEQQYPLPDIAASRVLQWIVVDGLQRPWVAVSRAGVYLRRREEWSRVDLAPEPQGEYPRAALADAAGQVWLGFPGDVVQRCEAGEIPRCTGLGAGGVGDIKVLIEGTTGPWVGGSDGVSLWSGTAFRSLRRSDGAALRNVAGLVTALDGSLWIAFDEGVARVAPEDVAGFAAGGLERVPMRLFDHLDGLPGAIQQATLHAAARRADDGRLWFATLNGLAWIDPGRLEGGGRAPPVDVRWLVSGEHRIQAEPGMQLPAGTRELRVEYTAPALAHPERTRFRYRLSGVDRGWSEAGARRQAYYTNLDPGEYRFEVVASNGEGSWNPQPSVLHFSIAPAFYQSRGFLLLCLVFTAALLWLLYRLRLHQVTQRLRLLHDARLVERGRIARELHDTLLQSVQGLILRFQAATLGLEESDPNRAALLETLVRANQTLAEGRKRVMNLRSDERACDLGEALEHLSRSLMQELGDDLSCEFSLRIEGEARPLIPQAQEELLKIAAEALRNAFQHARAGQIEVLLRYLASDFRLLVRDDGQGMPPEVLAAGGRAGHWGLAGMRERAFRIHASCTVESSPGLGTAVSLGLPASYAYVERRTTLFWRRWRLRRAGGDNSL